MYRRRQWQPTPILLPGKSHGQRSLVRYSVWGCKESDTTEWLHFTSESIWKSKDTTLPTKVHLIRLWFFSSHVWMWDLECNKAEHGRIDAFELWCWGRLLRLPWTARKANVMETVLGVHWKDWCWSWNYNTLATWCKELTQLKRPWCWERLKAGEEGDDRGWAGWMASLTPWTWVWANSGRWWRTGKPGVLQSMGLQRQTRLRDWTTASSRASRC